MIVLRISLTFKYALKKPAIPAQIAPPAAAAIITSGRSTNVGRLGTARAVAVEANAPVTIWPSPPMFQTFALTETQIPTATRRSGTAFWAVLASA